jgi:hypothetical protein
MVMITLKITIETDSIREAADLIAGIQRRKPKMDIPTVSSEAVEAACEKLDVEIASCDTGEKGHEKLLQEARDFLFAHHLTSQRRQ